MIVSILRKSLEWGWLRRKIAIAMGEYLAKRVHELPEPWKAVIVLNNVFTPGKAADVLAARYGDWYLRRPLLDTLEHLADRLDGDQNYLRDGVRAFRQGLPSYDSLEVADA
jgi:hypothetical protein